jgi:hypothetical protein
LENIQVKEETQMEEVHLCVDKEEWRRTCFKVNHTDGNKWMMLMGRRRRSSI